MSFGVVGVGGRAGIQFQLSFYHWNTGKRANPQLQSKKRQKEMTKIIIGASKKAWDTCVQCLGYLCLLVLRTFQFPRWQSMY